jgi:hypothetical protein
VLWALWIVCDLYVRICDMRVDRHGDTLSCGL